MKVLQRGFTLIELLVVISIIGILVAVLNVNFNDARETTRNKAVQAELQELQLALELYKAQNGEYPAASAGTPVGLAPDFIAELPNANDSGNSNCSFVYSTDGSQSYYKYTAVRCLAGFDSAAEGIQPNTELARCPSSCGTCGGTGYSNSYVQSPAFYESIAIYSLGGQCQ